MLHSKPPLCRTLIAVLFCTTAGSALAQNTTHPKSAPVTVVNPADQPVPVTGSVEVLNSPTEPLVVQNSEPTEPYAARGIAVLGTDRSASMSFDVPDGKRLVVETVTVIVQLPVDRNVSLVLNHNAPGGGSNLLVALSAEDQGVMPEGGVGLPKQFHLGTHPIRLRVDGGPADDEITIFVRTSIEPTDNGTNNIANGSISGYLVDL